MRRKIINSNERSKHIFELKLLKHNDLSITSTNIKTGKLCMNKRNKRGLGRNGPDF